MKTGQGKAPCWRELPRYAGPVGRPLGMDAQRVLSSPAALFLFLFYLLVYLVYFSDRIQGSGYFTAIAPAHRTLTALLTNSTTELDPILEEAKEKWFSNDVLRALHPPLPPPPPPSRQAAATSAPAPEEPRWAAQRLRHREPLRLLVAGMPHSGSEWLFQVLIILLEEAVKAVGQVVPVLSAVVLASTTPTKERRATLQVRASAKTGAPAAVQEPAPSPAELQAWEACRRARVCVAHARNFDEGLLDGSSVGKNLARPRPRSEAASRPEAAPSHSSRPRGTSAHRREAPAPAVAPRHTAP